MRASSPAPQRRRGKADRPKPSLKPKKIDETAWWYEDHRGIEIVVECRSNGHYVKTETRRIRWSAILKAAKRCQPRAILHLLGEGEEAR